MMQSIESICPDEIYNFAAQTQVHHSFDIPYHTFDTNISGLQNICNSVVKLKLIEKTKIYHASTSEMFGDIRLSPKFTEENKEILIDESFGFYPMSPYAVSKVSSYYMVQFFRQVYKLQICTGISFNHESPLRHSDFITRKISKGVARMKWSFDGFLAVGNIYAMRDWGHTCDYVRAFWMMLNNQKGTFKDYIIATQQSVTVKEFIELCFCKAGFKGIHWKN